MSNNGEISRQQAENAHRDGRTHVSKIKTAPGGVARNMAEAIRKLGHDPIFLSAVGEDLFGRELMRQFELMKMDQSNLKLSKTSSTAIYSALLNNKGECLFGLGDMRIHDEIDSDYIYQHKTLLESAPVAVLDANVPTTTIASVLDICTSSRTPAYNIPKMPNLVWFEPTEIRKARKICSVPWEHLPALSYISPNIRELQSIVDEASRYSTVSRTPEKQNVAFHEIPDHLRESPIELKLITECFQVLPALHAIVLTKGSDGIMVTFKQQSGRLESFCHPAPQLSPQAIISVSGAGDCLNAGFISGLLQGLSWDSCAQLGTACAAQSLQSIKNVPDSFTFSVNN
ncbi:Pseudouridine kinase [Orchesella cincta]|uniref:Pseudouridine kinase n=1 Tax=Orchesella cincta TaxID=48709 RepID=A0A1D2MGV0_ORCCI|nr:Pseudouridine kinase [Orchesella cincta]